MGVLDVLGEAWQQYCIEGKGCASERLSEASARCQVSRDLSKVLVRSLGFSVTAARRVMVWKIGSLLLCTKQVMCGHHQAWRGHCLLEDMLVSVLMLLVSVTTIADGNRDVCEYWGGSCLCVYTGETE